MNENEEKDIIAPTNDDAEQDIDLDFEIDEQEEVEDVDALKKQIQTLNAQKNHWKKKANTPKEAPKVEKKEATAPTLSLKDQMAIVKANVELEDLDEVVNYASYKKVSIAEALNDRTLSAILRENAEKRATSQATSTGITRKSQSTVSTDTLMENARKGNLPEKDEDLQRLVNARFEKK